MFLPHNREESLCFAESGDCFEVRSICANRERKFIAITTNETVYIWLANPRLLLCSLRDDNLWGDAHPKGQLRNVYWRPDSQAIAVTTNRNQIFIYSLQIQFDENCYNFIDSNDPYFQRTAKELFLKGSRPIVNLKTQTVINLADMAKCCVPLRDELIVTLTNGFTHHIDWSGQINISLSFRLISIPFSQDQLENSKSEKIESASIFIKDLVYAPLIGGYCIVLSDGRAALLTSLAPNFAPNTVLGVWAHGLVDATCCDVNHKYLLLMFGCQNGDICAFNIDEMTGGLVQTFRIAPKVKNGPDFTNRLGQVSAIRVASNGHGFAATWHKNGGNLAPFLAVFTPFGAQAFCSLEGVIEEEEEERNWSLTQLEWGPEGYHLWIGGPNTLKVQPMVRISSCSSPIMEHCSRAVLLSDSQVLISPGREREADACAPHSVWDRITVTHEYLAANWPLRYATTSQNFANLTVAGERGFAHYSQISRRWKIFGNESQEKNLIITGGLFFWRDLVIGAIGVEMDGEKSIMSFYPIAEKLDNRFVSTVELEAKATMVTVRDDICAIFDINAQITLFKLQSHLDAKWPKISADIVSVIRINELVPHPACILSIQMTNLNLELVEEKEHFGSKLSKNDGNLEKNGKNPTFTGEIDTILVNIGGRLITLSVSETGKLHQPIVIASFVEKSWHQGCVAKLGAKKAAKNGAHLENALWIACGAKGVKVWMPLIPGKRNQISTQEMQFIAKRIMLPFDLEIYPILISATNCLAAGVEIQTQAIFAQAKKIQIFQISRNSEVFIHHLLRQLLKRNLGVFALELGFSCRDLPYFSHSLELLLHGVLEEEATSSEPIPDPLLPRCVAFIHEFPEFLRTIAHCARKTELALWPALFDVTGSPIALFEECLKLEQLENAASFVIVLQNFESLETSMEQAARLVDAALAAKKWSIVKEMVRFAKSIGAEDMAAENVAATSATPPPSAKVSASSRRATAASSPSPTANDEFFVNRFQAAAGKLNKIRHSDATNTTATRKDSKVAASREASANFVATTENRLATRIYAILEEHCWKLLNEYYILDLGNLTSELDFDLSTLLESRSRQKNRRDEIAGEIRDFPLALTRLHAQFQWPYPLVGAKFVHQIEKKLGALRTSRSSASLSENAENFEANGVNLPPKNATEAEQVRISTQQSQVEEEEIHVAELRRVDVASESTSGDAASLAKSPSIASSFAEEPATSVAGEFLVAAPRASLRNAAQLEWLLKVFAQAGAIDWVFLLCLLSRDERRLWHEIQPAVLEKCGVRNFARTRKACSELARWAVEKCCGYVALLQAFDAHLAIVAQQAGIADVKYVAETAAETPPSRKTRENAGKNGGRARSRSVDRIGQKNVKRYDDVVCAEDVLEKVDDESCSIM